MVIFYSKKVLLLKILFASFIVFILVFGIWRFKSHQEFLLNFRGYYAWSYLEAVRLLIPNVKGVVASFSGDSFFINRNGGRDAVSIPVLIYHGIVPVRTSPNISEGEGYDVTLNNFVDQMEKLKEAGYHTITLKEMNQFLAGDVKLPEKAILITFDDGRKDSYYPVNPILKALGYNAAIFVITKESLREGGDSSYYLEENELRKIAGNKSWEIGGHSDSAHVSLQISEGGSVYGHFYSSKLWLADQGRIETDQEFRERITLDFKKTKEKLEKVIRYDLASFAFPFGDAGQYSANYPDARRVLAESIKSYFPSYYVQYFPGVRFTQNYFENQRQPPFVIVRISVKEDWTGEDLLNYLERGNAKSLPYEDDMDRDRGWVGAWHSAQFNGGNMILMAGSEFRGSGVILDGTKAWQNYYAEADIKRSSRNSAYMWVRFQDDNNFAACNFGDGFVHIERKLRGDFRVIRGTRSSISYPESGEFKIGAMVEGRKVSCLLNGQTIVSTEFLEPELSYGGIGFKSWDPGAFITSLTVKSLKVIAI